MSEKIACIGHEFDGVCHACDDVTVHGVLVTGEFATIDGRNICVTGSEGVGDCGHRCTVIGKSQAFFINGIPVARVGDPVTGDIDGVIITGCDYAFTE